MLTSLSSDQTGQPTVHLTLAVAKGIKKAPHQGQQPASSARARGVAGGGGMVADDYPLNPLWPLLGLAATRNQD